MTVSGRFEDHASDLAMPLHCCRMSRGGLDCAGPLFGGRASWGFAARRQLCIYLWRAGTPSPARPLFCGTIPSRGARRMAAAALAAGPTLVRGRIEQGRCDWQIRVGGVRRQTRHTWAMPDRIYPPEPWLADGVIALRALRADDASAITAACQDREIQRWVPLLPIPYTDADARGFILMSLQAWHDGTGCEFAIVDATDGRFLGAAGLHLGANARRRAIGYWVSPHARRRGVASRAVRLLSRWAFERLGTERLGLWTLPGNVASQAVAEKGGFRFEGLVRNWELDRDDNLIDAMMFAMTRDDFEDMSDSAGSRDTAAPDPGPAIPDADAPGAGGSAASIAAVPRELRASGTRAAPFVEISLVSELTPGSMRRVTRASIDLLVAWTPDGIIVTDDRCPHMAAPLSVGVLDGCVASCPLHEGRFDLRSGETVQMPTTGGLDADGAYHSPWSPSGAEPKPEPPSRKLEARRLTRVNRLRYYPARIRHGILEAQLPIVPE